MLTLERERGFAKLGRDGFARVLNFDDHAVGSLIDANGRVAIGNVGARVVKEKVHDLHGNLCTVRVELIVPGDFDRHRNRCVCPLEALQEHAQISVGGLEGHMTGEPAADPCQHVEATPQLSDTEPDVLQGVVRIVVGKTNLLEKIHVGADRGRGVAEVVNEEPQQLAHLVRIDLTGLRHPVPLPRGITQGKKSTWASPCSSMSAEMYDRIALRRFITSEIWASLNRGIDRWLGSRASSLRIDASSRAAR